MRAYLAFTKKEINEFIKTYKLFLILVVFCAIGFMSPAFAKLTPDILESVMGENMIIKLPEPTIIDSWTQFFKNTTQIGLIVLVIIFSNLISGELSKGTLINMLTKGLSRKTVILSKFTSAAIIWSLSYYLSVIITVLYSKLFWRDTEVSNLLFSVNIVWLFGLFLISLLVFGGVLFKSSYGAMLLCGLVVVCLFILNLFPAVKAFNPIQLISANVEILNFKVEDYCDLKAVCITVISTIALILLSVFSFQRKQL